MNENILTTELLKELRLNSKRWFIAFFVMVIVEILTIGAFLWYITLPIDETAYYEQEATQDDTDNSTITQSIGR